MYFTLDEMVRSSTARKRGIDNTPGEKEKENLSKLIENVLDPLRKWYGKPIKVNSGYRCEALNGAVGGARHSQHKKGEAADITAGTKEGNRKLINYIKENLPFDQVINEKNFTWIHVSYKEGANRKQVLKL